ncbi:(E3-independent) E2 ubiquitin-conjugating enzyme [Protopterus annectens]|uniref:(E3-independent) E2 ubiquitin-conjugating enzyme n=1 Tax=Protopterus annectens TaxID=7888 RepID=UPI001CFB6AD8|nr:(E3-independent) E2 ubiquitin-conjugating enzyme [Protopterus annectens]
MADPTDTVSAVSPSASPSPVSAHLPAPPSSSSQSSYPGSHRLLFSHDLVTGWYKGSVRLGLVRLIHGEEEESDSAEDGAHGSSDTESGAEQSRARPVRRDYVRVQWYPEGIKQDVKESKLKLEDRSVVPRDVVRRMSPIDSQCGTIIDVNIECAVKLVGTNHALYPVNSRELQHIWVQVVELKVTWITKSFCPGGTDSINPPPSIISQDSLSRVKRLGAYDHAQRQLGERCLYTIPSKVELSKIVSEGPEGSSIFPEGTFSRKVVTNLLCMYDSDTSTKAMPTGSFISHSSMSAHGSFSFKAVTYKNALEWEFGKRSPSKPVALPWDLYFVLEKLTFASFEPGRHVPFFLLTNSSTLFCRVAVEVVSTMTSAKVMWQDGTVEANIRSNELVPVHHLDNNEFCPGDFVVDKRVHMTQDPGIYGVIQSSDHIGRTCVVKWFKLQPSGSDVEVIRKEDDVSVYDIADHPDFRFRTTDIVIRIGNAENGGPPKVDEPSVGQVSCVDIDGKVQVIWADESQTIVLPQHLYDVESEIEESDYDSVDVSSSGASSDEWEDESDSWETDNGLTEEDHPKTDGAVVLPEPEQLQVTVPAQEDLIQGAAAAATSSNSSTAVEKSVRESTTKGCRELKEAIKILESLRNMTVEQLLTGSPTSPVVEPEKPTREKKFLDDIKKLQETLKKTLDNVAIVEEEKMEAVVEMEKEEEKTEAQTPVRSEWPSDTPVLCQQSGRPGVTFTSAKGEVFSILESAPDTHSFKKMEFQPAEAKKFFSTVRKEMALLATSLPDGIMVKTFEDRMDLFSALIKGPTRTPYEDGLFLFDIQLPNIYPAVPPLFRYLSQCSGRLNPNLYDNGKVCVSLLGTWIGKGTERWTSKSSLLQVLISIQVTE